ncbi:MAG: cytochrome c3 family protein [Desulfuromonas sp.]|nr:cytochrome c3 family protein [Desulfuromonas sp.]
MNLRATQKTAAMLCAVSALLLCANMACAATKNSCYACHDKAAFTQKVIHLPVAQQRCDQCHNPHLARYAGLLHKQGAELCAGCHAKLTKQIKTQQYAHQPALQGQCNSCHNPHATNQTHLLNDESHTLCLSCHDELRTPEKFVHAPFAQGKCATCHDAHSSDNPMLLRSQANQLCLGCHQSTSKLSTKHLNRDMNKIDCLECHQPHQADNKALLRGIQHQPFQQGKCQVCHNNNSGTSAICLTCHPDIMASFNQPLNHVIPDSNTSFCFSCHTPHASQQKGLLRGYPGEACRSCHEGKFEQRKESLHRHPNDNNCVDCHQLHGSSMPAMPKGDRQNNGDTACLGCHENHSNFSHPTGDKAHDPRNGKAMNCASCHDPCNGTIYKYNLRGTSDKGLCIQCHAGY